MRACVCVCVYVGECASVCTCMCVCVCVCEERRGELESLYSLCSRTVFNSEFKTVSPNYSFLAEVKEEVEMSRFGLPVRQKGFGTIPLRLSFLFKKVVVCGHCLVTLSLTIKDKLKWLSSLPILMQESFWW